MKGIGRTLSSMLSQAVEDEKVPANPALRMGRRLQLGDEPKTVVQPLTRDWVAHHSDRTRALPTMAPVDAVRPEDGPVTRELLALQYSRSD